MCQNRSHKLKNTSLQLKLLKRVWPETKKTHDWSEMIQMGIVNSSVLISRMKSKLKLWSFYRPDIIWSWGTHKSDMREIIGHFVPEEIFEQIRDRFRAFSDKFGPVSCGFGSVWISFGSVLDQFWISFDSDSVEFGRFRVSFRSVLGQFLICLDQFRSVRGSRSAWNSDSDHQMRLKKIFS